MKFWQKETPILDYIVGGIIGTVIVAGVLAITVVINSR